MEKLGILSQGNGLAYKLEKTGPSGYVYLSVFDADNCNIHCVLEHPDELSGMITTVIGLAKEKGQGEICKRIFLNDEVEHYSLHCASVRLHGGSSAGRKENSGMIILELIGNDEKSYDSLIGSTGSIELTEEEALGFANALTDIHSAKVTQGPGAGKKKNRDRYYF